jgi:hypothetical protein
MDTTVNDDTSDEFDWREDRAENGLQVMRCMDDLVTACGELRVGEGKAALLNELANARGCNVTAEIAVKLIESGDKIEQAAKLIRETYIDALGVMCSAARRPAMMAGETS